MERKDIEQQIRKVFDRQGFSTKGKRFDRVVNEIYFALERQETFGKNSKGFA